MLYIPSTNTWHQHSALVFNQRSDKRKALWHQFTMTFILFYAHYHKLNINVSTLDNKYTNWLSFTPITSPYVRRVACVEAKAVALKGVRLL